MYSSNLIQYLKIIILSLPEILPTWVYWNILQFLFLRTASIDMHTASIVLCIAYFYLRTASIDLHTASVDLHPAAIDMLVIYIYMHSG